MSKQKQNKNVKTSSATRPDMPIAKSGVVRPSGPRFGNSTNGVTIKRREFAGTVSNGAVTTFALSPLSTSFPGYDINPSCANLFPWLSHLSACYERFRFNKLKFDFIPSQATTTPGRYYAAVDYDIDDAPAGSKAEMMGNATCVEAPIWEHASLVCDPRSLNRDLPYRYVSCSTRGLDVEQRTGNSGFLMVAFDTPTANTLIDMWVEYEIELVTPVFDDAIMQNVPITASIPTTDVTVAAGTQYFGALNATSPVTVGPVRKVTSGLDTTPGLVVPVGGTVRPLKDAIDISGALFRGVLSVFANIAVTGVTPAAIMTPNLLNFMLGAFDSAGNYLGNSFTGLTGSDVSVGPAVQSELLTNDKYLRPIVVMSLDQLRNKYPTTRYLAPWVFSTVAALGAGYTSFGWRLSDM